MASLSDRSLTLLFAGVGLALFLVNFFAFGVHNQYEYCHYYEIVRHIISGEGYSTRLVEVSTLAYYTEQGIAGPPWPVVVRFPGYALFASFFPALFGLDDFTFILGNGLVFALLAGLVFYIGVRFFDRKVALIGTVVFLLHPWFALNYILAGFADPLFALAVWLLGLVVLHLFETERPLRVAALAGALTSVAFLVRFNLLIWVPIYVAFVALAVPRRRLAVLGVFAAGAALAYAPFGIWSLVHFGKPYVYLVSNWNAAADVAVTGQPWDHFRTYHLSEIVAQHWDGIVQKFSHDFTQLVLVDGVKLFKLSLLIPFCVAGCFLVEEPRQRRLMALFGLLFAMQMLVFAALRLELGIPYYWADRYFFWAAVPVVLFGIYGLVQLTSRFRYGWAIVAVVLVLQALVLMPDYHRRPTLHADEFYAGPYLREQVPDDALILSNLAYPVAQYFGKTTVSMPIPFDPVHDINAARRLDYIFYDYVYNNFPKYAPWQAALYQDGGAAFCAEFGYEVEKRFVADDGQLLGILLRSTRP